MAFPKDDDGNYVIASWYRMSPEEWYHLDPFERQLVRQYDDEWQSSMLHVRDIEVSGRVDAVSAARPIMQDALKRHVPTPLMGHAAAMPTKYKMWQRRLQGKVATSSRRHVADFDWHVRHDIPARIEAERRAQAQRVADVAAREYAERERLARIARAAELKEAWLQASYARQIEEMKREYGLS